MMKNRYCFIVSIMLFLCGTTYAEEEMVNAIFNGNFNLGVQGWNNVGPAAKNTAIDADVRWVDLSVEGSVTLKNPNFNQGSGLSLRNAKILHVKGGDEFELTLTAAGKGKVEFGSFFYDTDMQFKGSKFSQKCMLTKEAMTYRVLIKIPAGASKLMSAINFYEEDGQDKTLMAELFDFTMPVTKSRSEEICKEWLKKPEYRGIANYKGFTKQERAEMKAVADSAVNTVLPPYKPISMTGVSQYRLTTSDIKFDDTLLPASIKVLDKEILKGAIEFNTGTNGKRSPLNQATNVSIKVSNIQVAMTQSLENANAKMDVSCTLSYDALLLYNLEITPKQNHPLEKLTLRIPLDNDIAKYIYYVVKMRNNEDAMNMVTGFGAIPAAGEKVETVSKWGRTQIPNNWKPKVPPRNDGEIWSWQDDSFSTFRICDEKRGLAYCNIAEDDSDRVKQTDKAFTLSRTGDTVFADIVLFNKPLAPGKTYKVTFAFQVMPPKRVNPKWASLRFNRIWNLYAPKDPKTGKYMGNRLFADNFDKYYQSAADPAVTPSIFPYASASGMKANPSLIKQRSEYIGDGSEYMDSSFIWFNDWSVGCSTPMVKDPDCLKKIVKLSDVIKNLVTPYMAATHIAKEDKNGLFYAGITQEWATKPFLDLKWYVRACPNSKFSEYMAWGIGKMIDEYDITGIYFDNCHPIHCQNTKHGCGYIGADGKMHKEFPFLGMRKLFMMTRNEFVKRGKEPFILTHGGSFAGDLSFVDAVLEGEGYYGLDFTEMFSMGELRANWIGENQFGVKKLYLPQINNNVLEKYKDPKDSDNVAVQKASLMLISASLQHGFDIYLAGRFSDYDMQKVWQAFDKLGHQGIKFIPYWDLKELNKTLISQKVYASIYTSKDGKKAILALSNNSGEDKTIHIPQAQLATYISGENAFDGYSGNAVNVSTNGLSVNVDAKNFRIITFTDTGK